jgi:uncharacterized protein YjbI with pentapeptide repeats
MSRLDERLARHRSWLEDESQGERFVLEDEDLRGAELAGAVLAKAELTRCDLEGANLDGDGSEMQGSAYFERLWKAIID